jgi:microcystin-dependent protein
MEGTIAEIRFFAGTFAPKNWAFCQGQLLSISQNTALFSILGTNYGGDGRVTFGLPDFRGRLPVGAGQGPGLSSYQLGQISGTETVTLTSSNLPLHTHPITGTVRMPASGAAGNADTGQNNYPAVLAGTDMYSTAQNGSLMGNMQQNLGTTPTGQSLPISILQPVLGLNFVICIFGTFPVRN